MSAGTEPAQWSQPRAGTKDATVAWLDALASGRCSAEAFLGAMRDQFQGDTEESWEALSLLDQYYRRGKIKADLFQKVKSRLESSALREEDLAGASAPRRAPSAVLPPVASPLPRKRPPPAPPAEAPAAVQTSVLPDSSPSPREVTVGDLLRGRYRVRAVIGHGGMGTVFEALDEYRLSLPAAGQRLAIKVLHTAVTRREELLFELQREFQHVQLLSHPNIIRVHEFDRDGDIAFFTMELLNGAPLNGVLSVRNATPLPRPYALAILRDIGAALSYAHSHGVVHGDINPQNIFITNDGELRILDFGASRKMLRDRWTPETEFQSAIVPVATPGYASCQLLEGQRPDARDDVFACACVAYVLFSGRHPFPNRNALDARAQNLRPRRPPGLSDRQWRALRQGLHWDRERRPSDIREWLDRFDLNGAAARLPALPVLVNAPSSGRRRVTLETAVTMMFALLLAGGFWALADYDSVSRRVAEWSHWTRSALDANASLPVESAPAPPPALAPSAPPPERTRDPRPPVPTVVGVPEAARPVARPEVARAEAARPEGARSETARVENAPQPSLPAAQPAPATAQLALPVRSAPAAGATARSGSSLPARIEMAADTVEVQPAQGVASVVVRRTGNSRGEVNFTWWTESGTAKPGRDFAPMMPHVERIEDGNRSVMLSIPVSRAARNQPKSFYVVIERTEAGASLGERTLTMVTLQPG